MTKEEAKSFLIDISYDFGNMAIEYLTEKDGEKMREAVETLEQGSCENTAFWEWVPYDDDEHGDIVCSKCRAVEVECVWKYTAWAEIERIKYKHCPQCGAKITESEVE